MRATITKNCEWCGVEFTQERKRKPRFCGRNCAAFWRAKVRFNPCKDRKCEACGAQLTARDSRTRFCNRPECKYSLWPEFVRKSVEKQRALGFPNLNYDHSPTVPQKILFNALPGATMEFKLQESGNFSIDLAIPSLKLAIEIDGLSHTKRKDRERDVKKEQILQGRGWTLLRFWNKEVLGDFPSVLGRIQEKIAMLREVA